MKTRFTLLLVCALGACSSSGDTMPPPPDAPRSMVDARVGSDAPTTMTCTAGNPNSCSGETICIGTTCEPAFNRIYRFSSIAVVVASLNPNGSAWDPFGGAPDPYVELKLNGVSLKTTASASDVFQASFTETVETVIVAGSKLQLIASDADVGAADLILDCTIDPLTAATLRDAVVHCAGSGPTAGSTIDLHVDVKG